MGFSGSQASQVVLTGGGADMAGVAEYMQGALGRPVRVGKAPKLRGLPEAHASPGFATLAGLCLYAAEDPVDIRANGPGSGRSGSGWGAAMIAAADRLPSSDG